MTAGSQGAVTGAKINSELLYEDLGLDDNPGSAWKGSIDSPRVAGTVVERRNITNGHKDSVGNEKEESEKMKGKKSDGMIDRNNMMQNMKSLLEAFEE